MNSFRVKRLNRLDLPTPESPIRTTAGLYGQLEIGQRPISGGVLLTLEKELRRGAGQYCCRRDVLGPRILTSYSSFAMVVVEWWWICW